MGLQSIYEYYPILSFYSYTGKKPFSLPNPGIMPG